MIIGLTPFLYLHSTAKTEDLQDGIFHKIVSLFLFNREKILFSCKFMLTVILLHDMIIVLGRLGNRPVLRSKEASIQ